LQIVSADETVCVYFKFLAFYKSADYPGGQYIFTTNSMIFHETEK